MISFDNHLANHGSHASRGPKRRFPRQLRLLVLACLAGLLLPVLATRVLAQAVAAADGTPLGDVDNPGQQPLPGQELGSTLTLNQEVGAVNAENQEFHLFGIGGESYSGVQSNFFGTATDPKTATYTNLSLDLGLQLQSAHTNFFALYQPAYNIYPQYGDLSNFGQHYFHHLEHNLSARAAFAWDATAARYVTLNQYLPPTIGIGGVGVVVPNAQTQLLQNSFEMTNFATVLTFHYLASERMTFSAALTGSYFAIAPVQRSPAEFASDQKFTANGADLRLDYQLTPKDSIGVAVTPVYILGLTPSGHDTDEVVQATYQRQLTKTLSVRVGAGPLFIQAYSPTVGNVNDTNYAVNASLARKIKQSQFALSYGRAFVVSFLAPGTVAHSVGFDSYVPLSRNWIVTSNVTYVRDIANGQNNSGTLYGGSGQLAYQILPKTQLVMQYSRISQSSLLGQSTPYNFSRNQIGGGVRFNFGSPVAAGGNH